MHTLGAVQGADEELAAVFDVEDASDKVVLSRDGNVYVCKALLVARSPYFKSLMTFNSSAGAVKRSADFKYKIDWTRHSSDVVRALLLYLYTSKCVVRDQHIDELISLAAQVFVKSQRFEHVLSTLMDSMLKMKDQQALSCPETNNMLERMYEHKDSLLDDSAFFADMLQRVGGGANLWKAVFALPMEVDVAVLQKLKKSQRMQRLAQVTESTVFTLLQWATQLRTGDDELSDTKIVFDLLTWWCATSSSDTVREPFRVLLRRGGFDLLHVDPMMITKYVEPVSAVPAEELLCIYRAYATKSCLTTKGEHCCSYFWPALQTGTKLDVLDPCNNWYMARVLQVAAEQVLVHYVDFSSEYVDGIPVCSSRLAPVNTHTTAGQSYMKLM
jgi:BTB/POZ domain